MKQWRLVMNEGWLVEIEVGNSSVCVEESFVYSMIVRTSETNKPCNDNNVWTEGYNI